jgi:OmpA-OmpF porin, OOP family
MKKIALAALLSAFVAAPALAGDTGAYLSAELGSATLKNAQPFPDPGLFGFAAGYRFSPYIAAELGYTSFGDSTITSGSDWVTMKLSSFHPAVVGSYPINAQFSVFGKLGVAMNSEKYTTNLPVSTSSYSQNSTYLGFGGQYNFSQQFGMRLQYESFGDFDNVPPPCSATAVSVGVVYNF